MLTLDEILKSRRLNFDAKIKFIRHQEKKINIPKLIELNQFDIYQSNQGKDIFNCDYIVSFIGFKQTKAKFVGVYKVKKCYYPNNQKIPTHFIYKWMKPGKYYYDLVELEQFNDLKNRLIIEWGKSRTWHQWRKTKEIVEILPEGYVHSFPGYQEIILSFSEVEKIIKNPDANREWHRMLRKVAGVYLIVDKITGNQYVGSAYGKGGIVSRWRSYVETHHGGNKKLKELLIEYPDRYKEFQFSILETLPTTLTNNEVIAREVLHKIKLHTRAFGLNSN